MFKIHKLPLLIFRGLGYFIILCAFSGSATPACGQDKTSGIPSLGKGAYEIIMLTDYFCSPCYRIDTKAEALLKELLASGKVKITFVDVPIYSATPIYARYFLYAVNAGADEEKMFRIRKKLFLAAQEELIKTKEELVGFLKKEKIDWKEFDEKPVFLSLSKIIKNNKVDTTPSCVIKYSATDIKQYVGADAIWDGLNKLKAYLATKK